MRLLLLSDRMSQRHKAINPGWDTFDISRVDKTEEILNDDILFEVLHLSFSVFICWGNENGIFRTENAVAAMAGQGRSSHMSSRKNAVSAARRCIFYIPLWLDLFPFSGR